MLEEIHLTLPMIWKVTLPAEGGDIFYLRANSRAEALEKVLTNFPDRTPNVSGILIRLTK